eukprot:CAMPEP_0183346594 /NCGR_PEP_ID=MMETSP0164_2-20130417/11671_1 /TAXON_ID=221442 /ORGANISM="Coccolithus pelagicus ssp braarudi, Strain PLY182g" /LENGTH=175 /DNA_ID=CAMNT_0025517893 /DNA_START=134 /DNA_END=661 /DNA_ORIENTATION=+
MKPDWDTLSAKYEESSKVLIADVDCTTKGHEPLCEKYGVKGFPTIKYFNPPDLEGEVYSGGRTLADLQRFVEKNLGPACTVDKMENCTDEQKADLQEYMSMSAEERASLLTSLTEAIHIAEAKQAELLKELQDRYKKSSANLAALKKEAPQKIKLLTAATPLAKAKITPVVKDEV